MLSAMIAEAPAKSELRAIVGTAPALDARPGGCPFHPRCPRAQADCRDHEPESRPFRDVVIACHHPVAELAAVAP
jgi:oligopeptide/dipeptide ABC transporter ATP-binding protein